MSRYQHSTVQVNPVGAAQVNAVRSLWAQSAATLCSSAQLTSLATTLVVPATVPTARMAALRSAARLVGDTRMAELAASAGPETTARLEAVRTQLGGDAAMRLDAAAARLGGVEAARLLTELTPLLAREERRVVAAAAVDTLVSLGYTVIHEAGPAVVGIEARRDHEVMLLAVGDAGEINTDHLGAGGLCADRQARFEAGMAERGISVTSRAVTPHGDDTGPLITAAAAIHETSLARAVARHTKATTPARRRTRDRTFTGGDVLAGGSA